MRYPNLLKFVFLFSIAFVLLNNRVSMAAAATATPEAPDVFVKRVIADVLADISSGKVKPGDIQALNILVEQKIMPNLDFSKMTQRTVGKYWRDANETQRANLMKEFKALLTFTYTGALNQIKAVKVRYRPTRYVEGDEESEVRSSINTAGNEPIEVSYRLVRQGEGWKIYDLNIGGLWLVQNYKTSFDREIGQNGIEALINNLSKKNKELAGRENNKK